MESKDKYDILIKAISACVLIVAMLVGSEAVIASIVL